MGIKWEGFKSEDWLGFAGAEPFVDGAAPLIGELTVDGAAGIAVYDARGVEVFWYPEAGQDKGLALQGAAAGRAVAMMRPVMTVGALRALGFAEHETERARYAITIVEGDLDLLYVATEESKEPGAAVFSRGAICEELLTFAEASLAIEWAAERGCKVVFRIEE